MFFWLKQLFQQKSSAQKNTDVHYVFDNDSVRKAKDKRATGDLDAGRLPFYIMDRVTSVANKSLPWISTLSVNEFMLLKSEGFEIQGQVAGISVYKLLRGGTTIETFSNKDFSSAFHKASSRIMTEARHLGANMIVDAKLELEYHLEYMELSLYGTAVRMPEALLANIGMDENNGFVGLSTISAVKTHKLLKAGYVPLRLCVGTSTQRKTFESYNIVNVEEKKVAMVERAQENAKNECVRGGGANTHIMLSSPRNTVMEREFERNEKKYVDSCAFSIVTGMMLYDMKEHTMGKPDHVLLLS